MEEVKYIPGDLAIFGENIIKIIQSTNTKCWFEGVGFRGYVGTMKELKGIPLTHAILEGNGWKLARQGIDDEKFEYFEYEKGYEYPVLTFYPCKEGQNMSLSVYIKGRLIVDFIQYCHQLQHLLFGLGLNSELKV